MSQDFANTITYKGVLLSEVPGMAARIAEQEQTIQRLRSAADNLAEALKARKCTCNGTGLQHKPGYTHYETDAGEECPAYHYGPCPRCELSRAALAQYAEMKSKKLCNSAEAKTE